MIYAIHRFEDDEGKTVIERVPVAPSTPLVHNPLEPSSPGAVRIGIAGIQTPQGTMQIEFPIPADITLEAAFARYEEFALAQIEKMREEQPRVQVPSPGVLG